MYRALCNVFCEGKQWNKGEVYKEKEIAGLDKSDFEKVTETQLKKEKKEAPKGLTTKNLVKKKK